MPVSNWKKIRVDIASALKHSTLVVVVLGLTAVSVLAADPTLVARWDFDGDDPIALQEKGAVRFGEAGPRSPEFPNLSKGNKAIRLDGKGARLVLADTGKESRYKFQKDDPITLEAWVKLNGRKPTSPMYLIGKGRTGDPAFNKNNQNWSLRVMLSLIHI